MSTLENHDSSPKSASIESKEEVETGVLAELYPVTDLDNGLVGWEGQDDPQNPGNFPEPRKWLLLGFVSSLSLIGPLCSSIAAPGVPLTDADFKNTSSILSSLAVTIFVFGFAIGPLVLSPLSEIFGRRPILNYSNAFFTIWQISCAKVPNIGSLIAFRFLGGLGASAALTIGGGVISDLFLVKQRGMANATFSLGPLFRPVVGPIIGGFIAQRAGWIWVYWVMLITGALLSLGVAAVKKETNPTVLIRYKTEKLKKELGRNDLRSVYATSTDQIIDGRRQVLLRGLVRPFRILFSSPILMLLSIYLSFVFGLLYLLFTTVTTLFIEVYRWSPELCGLAYLGIGIGFMVGIVVVAKTSDATVIRLTKANNGVYQPEMRLARCIVFAFLSRSASFVPILGLMPFGFGMMGIFAPIQTYFIDAGGQYAASAVAGLTVLRCIFGGFLPLAGPKLFESLGLGWGNSLLGFVALGLIPAPALIFKFGEAVRRRYPIRLE